MRTERGLHRLMNFSDAVVAIAITLLILPLVDSASNIGIGSVGPFLQHHDTQLLAFGLSFAVIWNFWWSQHQMHERVVGYNRLLVAGMFVWILSIVFLPFPTELLSSAAKGGQGVHGLYIGTMLIASLAVLAQAWAVAASPEPDQALRASARWRSIAALKPPVSTPSPRARSASWVRSSGKP